MFGAFIFNLMGQGKSIPISEIILAAKKFVYGSIWVAQEGGRCLYSSLLRFCATPKPGSLYINSVY